MRKERMTVQELEELLKENKTVKLVCDDGHYYSSYREIEVLCIYNTMIIFIDSKGELESFPYSSLENYQSLKPERETIDLYWTFDNTGFKCLCDSDGNHPDFNHKRFNGIGSLNEFRKKHKDENPCMKIDAKTFEIIERY